MKMFLLDYSQEAGEKADFQSHRLDKLWTKCLTVIRYYYPNDREEAEIHAIEKFVIEFTFADGNSFACRYAHNGDGLDINIKESTINPERLRKR